MIAKVIIDVTSLREGTHYYPKADGTDQLQGKGTLYGYIDYFGCNVKVDFEAYDERNNKWIDYAMIIHDKGYAFGAFSRFYENFVFDKYRIKVEVSKKKEASNLLFNEILFLSRLKIVVL